MANSAVALNTDKISKTVNQVGHGFVVGEIVRWDDATNLFVYSLADNPLNCFGSVMVSYVYDANTFGITQVGFVYNVVATTFANVPNYLSTTNAGQLQNTEPVGVGEILFPCYYPFDATSGFFWGGFGVENSSGPTFGWSVINANQTLGVNQGYFINGGGALNNLLLPAATLVGDTIELWDIGGNGFTVTQGVGQSNIVGTVTTVAGVGGSVQSTALGNKLVISCHTANTGFITDVSMTAGASIIVT